ncbi:hypothetical protein BJF84_19405 [Rhodococcus sp. CUA-806]|nr:hypothetical protein BJF84_19405 [Rhodococcus sp. CUA-806]
MVFLRYIWLFSIAKDLERRLVVPAARSAEGAGRAGALPHGSSPPELDPAFEAGRAPPDPPEEPLKPPPPPPPPRLALLTFAVA